MRNARRSGEYVYFEEKLPLDRYAHNFGYRVLRMSQNPNPRWDELDNEFSQVLLKLSNAEKFEILSKRVFGWINMRYPKTFDLEERDQYLNPPEENQNDAIE